MECGRSKARAWLFNPVLAMRACMAVQYFINRVKVKKRGKHAKLFANAIQAARDVAGTAKP